MTTKDSPLEDLKAQADNIATMLKNAEAGVFPQHIPNIKKVMEARSNPTIKVGIVMDDKVLAPELEWATIRGMSHHELSRWIVRQMREQTTDVH